MLPEENQYKEKITAKNPVLVELKQEVVEPVPVVEKTQLINENFS